jgi:hypothetical protein
MSDTPLTDAQLVQPWTTDSDHRAVSYTDYQCLSDFARSLERDCLTLALRLYGEDPDKNSPEVAEVMARWRSKVVIE